MISMKKTFIERNGKLKEYPPLAWLIHPDILDYTVQLKTAS